MATVTPPTPPAPPIDARTFADLVAEVEALAEQFTAGALPPEALAGAVLAESIPDPDGGPDLAAAGTWVDEDLAARIVAAAAALKLTQVQVQGWQRQDGDLIAALIRIFAHLSEIVLARLNRLPERNFLAFLDLIGTELLGPQAARVPLTFALATGSPGDAVVPARTAVAATPLGGETEPVVFETERDLVVTRSRLVAAAVREPGADRWRDVTAVATGAAAGDFSPFAGSLPIDHRLYVGHSLLANQEKRFAQIRLSPLVDERPWPSALTWERWDGAGWTPVAASVDSDPAADGANLVPAWVVTFLNLPPIPPAELPGVPGVVSSWLRASLDSPLPSGVLTQAVASENTDDLELRRASPASAALAGDATDGSLTPLDLGRPFLPFGERWASPFFHLAFADIVAAPGTVVEIELDVLKNQLPLVTTGALKPGGPVGVFLQWESSSADGWTRLEGLDFLPGKGALGGGVFLDSGTVRFPRPPGWQLVEIAGIAGYWLRVTALPDGAKSDRSVSSSLDIAYEAPVVTGLAASASWLLPRLDRVDLSVSFSYSKAASGQGFSGQQQPLDLSKDFLPFGDKPRVGDAFYLPGDDALARPGATVQIHLTLTNATNATAQPAPAQPSADLVLAWEFWDGAVWQVLGYSKPPGGSAALPPSAYNLTDGTGAFKTDAANVSFLCPSTLLPTTVGGTTGRFLRVRLHAGNYGVEAVYTPIVLANGQPSYQLVPATFKPPSIRSIQWSYTYNSSSLPAEILATENDFAFHVEPAGSRAPGALLTPFTPPRDVRPTLYLGFERPGDAAGFGNRPASLYFDVAAAYYDPAAEPQPVVEAAAVVWEYWQGEAAGAGGHWQPLGSRDETRALTRRGLVTFIGPADFRASTELGRTAFWLRARWERGDYAIAPRLARILLNTTWAAGGAPGTAGNIGNIGNSLRLKGTVPYVAAAVGQAGLASGGAAAESLAGVQVRGPRVLRHRDRAAAPADFEDLALAATTEVARARCLPAHDGGEAGRVGLVVVPRSSLAQPVPDIELLDRVQAYVEARLSPAVDLWTVGPDWLQITVEAEIVPTVLEAATDTQSAVRERLAAFLHPLTGGDGGGWPFGRRPHRSDLFALIEQTPGVDHVNRLDVTQVAQGGFARPERFLIFSGDHRITVTGGTDDFASPAGGAA